MRQRPLTRTSSLRLATIEQRLSETDNRLDALEEALVSRRAAPEPAAVSTQAGWSIPAWCAATDLSKSTFYDMPPDVGPRKVRIGARTVVLEAPKDWLERRRREQEREAAS